MKKIVWITTGGTIACTHHDDGLSPTLDSKQMLEALGPYQNQAEILFDDLLANRQYQYAAGRMGQRLPNAWQNISPMSMALSVPMVPIP